jgi:hypothetical protein
MPRSRIARLYNPAGLTCGCPPECTCQRNPIGRLLRWYIPGKYHSPLGGDEKRRLAAAEGRSFR